MAGSTQDLARRVHRHRSFWFVANLKFHVISTGDFAATVCVILEQIRWGIDG